MIARRPHCPRRSKNGVTEVSLRSSATYSTPLSFGASRSQTTVTYSWRFWNDVSSMRMRAGICWPRRKAPYDGSRLDTSDLIPRQPQQTRDGAQARRQRPIDHEGFEQHGESCGIASCRGARQRRSRWSCTGTGVLQTGHTGIEHPSKLNWMDSRPSARLSSTLRTYQGGPMPSICS